MFRPLLNLALLVTFAFPAMAETTPEPARQAPNAEDTLFTSEGFRQDRYRSPTPASAPGARTVDTETLQSLLEQNPDLVLIDVINVEYRHDRFLQDDPHHTIPQAYWLPNTGKGSLDTLWHDYLMDNLARLTANDPEQPVVVFCKSDCWLSWNAAKRITEAGYNNVYWYRDGIDSWVAAGLPTRTVEPVDPKHS
ncbi:PQQ-dependent catabolism-associated CXXCW motif protein [Marinobacter nanhaiticus D15-8W]|uniref:PQQ-dependent catabolism-associated CXXCW motif protein n=1 Tax=Marinobacter nanhaiticus D15-8W TaxID=626887 RepID=N6WWA2_9GAMM|nr:rhodanese-like domain-containing protein [Marinobacter nanhaiticus]ENO15866.1 PQQ-dependent catabolism-associated CXXCW motif protein [Marinobacter nanhaiticus D15-8W]BES73277.1 PQQ-dependent catabolism-associated CXXCW motif protein [Marinobacter nanhaiticus D15-8W]